MKPILPFASAGDPEPGCTRRTRPRSVAVVFISILVSLRCAAGTPNLISAASAAGERKVSLGQSFSLRPGEWAAIESESLTVGFVEVTGDSRCPSGEQCVWAGDATLKIWIEVKGRGREEREVSISGRESGKGEGSKYRIRVVRLDPRPVSGQAIRPGDYEATLQVLTDRAAPPS